MYKRFFGIWSVIGAILVFELSAAAATSQEPFFVTIVPGVVLGTSIQPARATEPRLHARSIILSRDTIPHDLRYFIDSATKALNQGKFVPVTILFGGKDLLDFDERAFARSIDQQLKRHHCSQLTLTIARRVPEVSSPGGSRRPSLIVDTSPAASVAEGSSSKRIHVSRHTSKGIAFDNPRRNVGLLVLSLVPYDPKREQIDPSLQLAGSDSISKNTIVPQ